jgi:hypothetical protein
MKKPGSAMLFTGGAGQTPKVTVDRYPVPGIHFGDKVLRIEQGTAAIILDAKTFEAILEWYKKE